MTTIEKIRAEIERLKKNENELIENSTKKYGAYPASSDIMLIAYQNVLSILSNLEESEKPMNQDELDKEIEEYFPESCFYTGFNSDDVTEIARHFAKWGAEHRGSSEIPNDLKEAVKNYIYKAADSPGDDWTTDDIRNAFIAGYKLHEANTPLPEDTVLFNKGVEEGKRLMMEDAVKWLVDDDYHEASEKGRFILGSVGLGYNGYYIPYLDLLKLPKED